jgi:hypothetical protein
MSRQFSQNGAPSSQIENKLLTHSQVMPCALVIHGSDISQPFDSLRTMSFRAGTLGDTSQHRTAILLHVADIPPCQELYLPCEWPRLYFQRWASV